MSGEQLHFLFPQPDTTLDQLFIGIEDASYLKVLRQWRDWPNSLVSLSGSTSSGVTTILEAWAREVDGAYLKVDDWSRLDADELARLAKKPLALDDVDQVTDPHKLLTILNLSKEHNLAALIGGHGQPANWHSTPQDLVSRLSASTRLILPELDDVRFQQRLRAACLQRYIDLPEETVNYLVTRLEHDYETLEQFVDTLNDVMGREKKPASVPVARMILSQLDSYEDSLK